MYKDKSTLLDERFLYLLLQMTDAQKQDVLQFLHTLADKEVENRGAVA